MPKISYKIATYATNQRSMFRFYLAYRGEEKEGEVKQMSDGVRERGAESLKISQSHRSLFDQLQLQIYRTGSVTKAMVSSETGRARGEGFWRSGRRRDRRGFFGAEEATSVRRGGTQCRAAIRREKDELASGSRAAEASVESSERTGGEQLGIAVAIERGRSGLRIARGGKTSGEGESNQKRRDREGSNAAEEEAGEWDRASSREMRLG